MKILIGSDKLLTRIKIHVIRQKVDCIEMKALTSCYDESVVLHLRKVLGEQFVSTVSFIGH